MKNTLAFLFFFVALNVSFAQAPPLAFNYSGVARNPQGNLISNTTIGIQFSILKTTALGPIQYQENHFTNTDAYGLFNLVFGSGAIQVGSMSTIDWSADNYFLQVSMDATGGTNFIIMGTTQLLSVPYSLYSKTAGSISGVIPEIDPVWQANSTNYYSKTEMQIGGMSQLHFNNITNKPNTLAAFGITDAVNNFGDQVIQGIKTFNSMPVFLNGIKFSDNTVLNTGNIGKWTFDGTKNTTLFPVSIPQSGLYLGKLIEINDFDPNSHTSQYENDVQNPIIYGRYFYGQYGDLIIQGQSKGYTSNIQLVTGSTVAGSDPPTQRMVIMGNGNVGVGNFINSPPKSRLDVKSGDVYISDISKGIILKSPNGQCWRVTIDNSGNLIRTSITCP